MIVFSSIPGTLAIENMTFKNHGCCGHIFAALDAVRDLKSEIGFGAADVEAFTNDLFEEDAAADQSVQHLSE